MKITKKYNFKMRLKNNFFLNRKITEADFRFLMTRVFMVGILLMTAMLRYPFAQTHPFEGEGTEENPFQIVRRGQLDSIRNYPGAQDYRDDHYVLMNDLDFTGYEYEDGDRGWRPISSFRGRFNGNGRAIKNLFINRGGTLGDNIALFGSIESGARIDSLGIEGVDITVPAGFAVNGHRAAGLAGENRGLIRACYVSGKLVQNDDGTIAGLVAFNDRDGVIQQCYAAVDLSNGSSTGIHLRFVGGLVGTNTGTINDCYAFVTGGGSSLVSSNGTSGTIRNCYGVGAPLFGSVPSRHDAWTIENSYWNTDLTNQDSDLEDSLSLTTEEMYEEDGFKGWDFTNIWIPPVNGAHFPQLRSTAKHAQILWTPPLESNIWKLGESRTVTYQAFPPTLSGSTVKVESSNEGIISGVVSENSIELTAGNRSGNTMLAFKRAGNEDYISISIPRGLQKVHPFKGGSGSPSDPFLITTPAQLDSIRDRSGEGGNNYLNYHYALVNDIDVSGYNWQPIGHDTNNGRANFQGERFQGTFNGRGNVIRNLFIDRSNQDYVGLFGFLDSSAKVDSLGLEDVRVVGGKNAGGLVGVNDGTIARSYVAGTVTGKNRVGGLAGLNRNDIEESYTSVWVTGVDDVGGLVGENLESNDNIINSYATGAATGNDRVGGMVGRNGGMIAYSFATNEVEGNTDVGGLVGKNNSGVYTFSYWNTTISGQMTSDGGTALNTEEMHDPNEFASWDFYDVATNSDGIWLPPSTANEDIPRLRRIGKNAQVLIFPSIGWIDVGIDLPLQYTLLPSTSALPEEMTTSSNQGVATVTTSLLTTLTEGTTAITISRLGNDDYLPISVSREIEVVDHPFVGGTGTIDNPFQVETEAQLDSIRNNTKNGGQNYLSVHYELLNDLDFSDYGYANNEGWQPIGHDTIPGGNFQGQAFTGTFKGRGNVIHGLTINRPNENYVGLFGRLGATAVIDSLGVDSANVVAKDQVGILVGWNNQGLVKHSYVSGHVSGNKSVGSVAGINHGTIEEVHASGRVLAGNSPAGGLVASNHGTVRNSYSSVSVLGVKQVGGLVGIVKNNSTVENSFSVGWVSGKNETGGLVGKKENNGEVTASYWNTVTSGQSTSQGGEGYATTDMLNAADHESNFSEWNFTDIWLPPVDDESFPRLRRVKKNVQMLLPLPPFKLAPRGVGENITLDNTHYLLLPATFSEGNIIYKSSDRSVASVTQNGQVQTIGAGVTQLTVSRQSNDDYLPATFSWSLVVLTHPFAGGMGTTGAPYQIATPEQLNNIRDYGYDDVNLLEAHYELINDIDFSTYTYADDIKKWQPIGHDTDPITTGFQGKRFSGVFNGKNHTISNLSIFRPGEDHVGLFGSLDNATIIDSLGVDSVNIVGKDRTAALAGTNRGKITFCHVSGQVSGDDFVGGIAGILYGPVVQSYASIQVSGDFCVGGLIGWSGGGTTRVERCYASGQVSGDNAVGGLIGSYQSTDLLNNYASVQVFGTATVGGLVGRMYRGFMENCYSSGLVSGNMYVGGLVGSNGSEDTPVSSYWNTELSGQSDSEEGMGFTTAVMSDGTNYETNFSGWDFTSVWLPPVDNESFPRLRGMKNAQVLSFHPLDLNPSGMFSLDYTFYPSTLTGGIETQFTSSDAAVATVASGDVNVLASSGSAFITISRPGNDEYAPIHISQAIVVLTEPFSGGMGTTDDPYQISSPAQLDAIRNYGFGANLLRVHYALTADLDFSTYNYADNEKKWLPIGHDLYHDIEEYQGIGFDGTFNGRGHVIHGLSIARPDEDFVGLFGVLNAEARIDSLGIENLNIEARNNVGGLVGFNLTTISTSYAVGEISGENSVGGLIGLNRGSAGLITECYTDVMVSGVDRVGGLLGENSSSTSPDSYVTTISDSYAIGQVSGQNEVGGLIGYSDASGPVRNSYAVGAVSGNTGVGGLIGIGSSTVESSYWNQETSNLIKSSGGSSLTSQQMYQKDNFVGWDFMDIWMEPNDNVHFPLLQKLYGQQTVTIEPAIEITGVGETIEFILTREGLISRALTVNVEVTETKETFTMNTPKTIDFNAGVSTVTFEETPTFGGNTDEVLGTVQANLKPGIRYKVGSPESARTFVSDVPVIIIAGVGSVNEGTDATFTLTRLGETTEALSVNVEVTQEGNVTTETGLKTIDFTAGVSEAELTVSTVDNEIDEKLDRGSITATVKSGTGYAVGDPAAVTVIVMDDDLPMVTIAGGASVTEGANVIFTLTRVGVLTETLSVNVEVTQNGDVTTETGSRTVEFVTGSADAELTVATVDDEVDESDAAITATIGAGVGYRVGDPSVATVTVIAGESLPVVTVAGGASVTEGTNATFTLTRIGALTEALSVNVEVTQEGGVTTETGSKMVEFAVGLANVELTVATVDNEIDEKLNRGSITATVKSGTGYVVGDPSAATVTVTDDDLPTVTIAGSSSGTEGMNVTFTLTRVGATTNTLTVNAEVTQDGDVTTETGSKMVEFAANSSTVTLTVTTVDDEVDESGSTITATVKSGADYVVGDPSTATVTVTDDDLPVVTITGDASVAKGTNAIFTLTRVGVLTGALSVNVEVTQDGNVTTETETGLKTVEFAAGSADVELSVVTVDDEVDNSRGTITATINDGTGYLVGAEGTATVSVTDGDIVGLLDKEDGVLYPNPVRGQLHIYMEETAGHYLVSVYTLSGKQKLMQKVDFKRNPVSLNVSDFEPGTYLVKLTNANGESMYYRMIKE